MKAISYRSIIIQSGFLIFCLNSGFSQNEILYPDFLYQGYGSQRPLYILFHDSITDHSDTLWLSETNPFNNLKFKKTGINNRGYAVYKLSSANFENLIPATYRVNY